MSEQFLGEIRRVAFDFPPKGWALCNGQVLSIAQNQALFSLLGTTYGGNGTTTFALPDLRGRTAVHPGMGVTQGQSAGEAAHTLTVGELPLHTHGVRASSVAATVASPQGAYWAASDQPAYGDDLAGSMSTAAIATAGSAQPHENLSPYLVVNHIIALTGVFPSRN
ncbi:MAG: phage tail protein [Microbacterium sp.]|nr:phage tail protein [Microbacterium sp.]